MSLVDIEHFDSVYIKLNCDNSTAQELSDYFTFMVPGAQFTPAFRNKFWDGKIRLFNVNNRLLYAGLYDYVLQFCKERNYDVTTTSDFTAEEFSLTEAEQFIKKLNPTLQPRDYQISAFVHAVRRKRSLLLSPTASGKSFIIYLLMRYYNARTLIIVPTTTLVHQLSSDFESYGYESNTNVHKIFSGQEKDTGRQVTITTWQSIYKMPKKWFDDYDVVIGDEAHLFKAKSLTSILTKMTDCEHRFGFTGTLDGTQTHKLVLEGLFGRVFKVTTTAELIEKKQLADFAIKCLVLNYSDASRKLMKGKTYHEEIEWIVLNKDRNRFIRNLAVSLKGNTLLLYQFVDKHGKVLYDIIKAACPEDRKVFFVHGGVEGEERDQIRRIVEQEKDAIIIASYGTFSTGINIPSIANVVFTSPSKSRVRNLQSIGRGLRISNNKTKTVLYDISDDLQWKLNKNHTILHFHERIKIYNEEKFQYKLYSVKLKEEDQDQDAPGRVI
jgi:superfamily II DNA or RNA helicase